MKLAVVSTPKTGNKWTTHLLSAIYGLPEVQLPRTFDPSKANQLGPDWVAMQHYYPDAVQLAWGRRRSVQFVTTVRHPGDVLVSLRHMIRNESYDPRIELRRMALLVADGDQMGQHATEYVKNNYFYGLYISLMWMRSGQSLAVRYEDLWRDPVAALTDLTNAIQPVPQHRIESAIEVCDMSMLRKLYNDPEGKFFRKGGPGSWREELPESILEVFAKQEPYPSIFQALGYTLDPDDALIAAPAKPRASTNPFRGVSAFDNGAQIPTIAVKLYLLQEPGQKTRWSGAVTSTAEGSFFDWLNSPVEEDPVQDDRVSTITNLASYVYHSRRGLQELFPDLLGNDRNDYAAWFVRNAKADLGLDPAFIAPMREGFTGRLGGSIEGRPVASTKVAASPGLGRPEAHAELKKGGRLAARTDLPAALLETRRLARVSSHWNIAWPVWPKGVLPKAQALAQKVIRGLLRWYIDPIVEQQNRFNSAVVQALEMLWREIVQSRKQDRQEEQARDAEVE
jgi:hypothetical protein